MLKAIMFKDAFYKTRFIIVYVEYTVIFTCRCQIFEKEVIYQYLCKAAYRRHVPIQILTLYSPKLKIFYPKIKRDPY